MKLAKFLRVSTILALLMWIAYPMAENAQHPKPKSNHALSEERTALVPLKKDHQSSSTAQADSRVTAQQVSELAPALRWLTPYLAPASDRARGQKFVSPFVPSISALKTFAQTGTDLGTPGPTPGDILRYTVVISNAGGAMDATGVQFSDQIDPNTTLVPNSLMSGPIAVDDSYSTVGNTSISVPAGSGLMTNDVNLNGTPMTVTSIDDTGTSGDVTFNANGSFTFNPDPGFTGNTTFTYTVNNGFLSATGTVTVTVTGMIWYINAAAAPGGDGRLSTPWNSMNSFNATSLDDPGDNIFVYSGTYTNTLSTILLGQQKLIGQGAAGASLAALAGVTFSTFPPISPAVIPAVNGTNPNINQAANNINMQSQNEVRGVNIINTGGTALLGSGFTSALVREVNITNTGGVGVNFTTGALDMIIQKVDVSNSSTGIFLSQTTGSFQITGTGTTDGSGGTFSNISGRGIELRNVTNITLKNLSMPSANNATDGGFAGVCDEVNVTGCYAAIYMDIANTVTLNNIDIGSTKEHGIMGNSVSNLSITNCTATGNGDAEEENALKFRNLSGTCSITGSTFQNSAYRIAHIINTTGNLNLTVSNCTFNNTASSAVGQDCFEMRTQGTATATVSLTGSSFQRARSKAIQIQAEGTSTMNLNITYCRVERFGGAMAGIDVASNGAGSTMNYNINNNPVIESSAEVAALASTLNSTLNGRLNRNLSIDNNYPLAGGSIFAITRVLQDGSGAAKVEMKGNLSVTGNNLDLPVDFQSVNGTNTAHRFDAIVDSNVIVNNASGGVGIEGLYLRVGTSSMGGKINTLCGDITRNKVTVPASAGGRAFRANRVDASSFLTLSGTSPVATMWPGNGNSNTNGTINASAGVVFTGMVPPGCNAPSHASFAPINEEIASNVNDGGLSDQALNNGVSNKNLVGQQKNVPVKPKAKEAELSSLQMVMAGETVTVGAPSGFLLPAGKSITIQFDVTINTPLPAGVCQISNQGSVSGGNFSTILTDDVAGAPINPTVTQLSKHSLGDRVFKDNNKNGTFDGGDAGIVGVVVNLYRDNGTTPGILDASDAFITFTTTNASGLYAFSNLCSDDYIVQIPSSEFGVGEPLNGLVSSPTGPAPDPDNNTDNDDNGQDAFGSSIASQAITLSYSTSFVENNTTLDFGFKTPTNVSINDRMLAEGSGGGTTTFTFTVTRDDISEAFSLDVNTGVISTNNGDYTAISGGTVSFTAGGSPTATIDVVVNADDIVELNETFNVLLSNAPAGVVITDGTGLGTITNDDQATLSINSVSNNEGNAGTQTYTFTVTSDKAVDVPFTVNAATANGTATTGDNDYVAVSSTALNFAGTAGETKTFDVTVNGDMKVEPNEFFMVPLSAVSASGRNVVISVSNATGIGTINNDDAATISIDDVSLAEGNAGTTNFTFNVTLSKPVSTAITVNFTTANGTANGGGADYNTNSGMVTFPANGTGQTQQITVQVIGDLVGEANETFFVNLSNLVGSTDVSILDAQGVGTILDDDLSFSINDVTLAEGNAGTTNFTFTVTRTSTATAETIDFTTANNTATTGDNDYVLTSGTLNFAIGDDSETITVVVNGDNKVELNETFFVNLSNVSNGSIGDGQGLGTITNDDQATITVNSLSKTEGDAGSQNYDFTVTLDKEIDVPVSVNIATSNILATSGSGDFVANSTTLNFAGTAGETKTFTVVVNGDMIVEPDENFGIVLSNLLASSRNVILGSAGNGTILNDDAATISIDDVTKVEGDAGTTDFEFTVTLSKVVSTAVSFDFTTAGITATSGVDFNPNSNTITFPANGAGQTQTITVQVNGDVLGEANETFTVDLSNIVGSPSVTFADAQGLGTIEDDDLAFSINDVSIAEGNAGTTNLTFTVTRTSTATAETIDFTTANNTATTADNDYVLNSGTLNFAIGDDTETITVVLNGDIKVEANETFFVNLSNASNGNISDAQGVGTINNDDAAVVHLQLLSANKAEGNVGTTNFTFTATLNNPVQGGFDLAYTSDDGTATIANNDYQNNDGTLSFAGTAGEQKTITVLVNGDTDVEPNETFTVSIEDNGFSNTTVPLNALSTASTVIATIQNDDSDINAGNDTTICASTIMIQLHGTVSGASTGGTWTTSGTGTFIPNANDLNAKYMFTAADTAAGQVTLTLTGNGPSGEFDVKIVTIDPASIVNAGPDQTICATDTIYLNATLSGVATNLVWQLNAAFGSFVGSDTSPNTKYVLNATGQQLSSLKFGVMSNDPGSNVCQGGLDTVQIFINPAATVDAGPDRRICASQDTIHLNGSIGGAATGATWSGGTGIFSPNTATLNAVYTFTAADTAANVVKLYLTTNDPTGLCGPAIDSIIITIDPESIVNAGPDQTICAADTIYLSATLSGVATNLVWQKNAAFGTFIGSDTSPNAKYVLNAAGMLLSSLKFGVMSNDPGSNVCQGGLDTVEIFINPKATVEAGSDRRICASQDTIHLNGSFGGAATGATWSGGTGTFTPNASTLNAVYTFTAADTAANVVKLYLTTNDPTGLCGPAKDSIIITIDPESIVNAGPDQTICAADTIYLSATLSGVATNLVWQKNAAFGTFIGSDTSPNAKYVLNATGMLLSSLKFGVMSNDPGSNVCQGGLDTVEIFINPKATVDAGPDRRICASQDTIHLNGSIGGAATGATWSGGTGSFSPNTTTLNAVYTFTAADTAANVVKLYLTTNDPAGLCGPAIDSIIITIDPESIVDAGPDQTVCATDTIYLSATLSGVATNLVWQKNAAFGTFVGSDTSPDAKFVLNATGQQLSSIKFGVMSNDPGSNVCQGGLDTVEIFISDPILSDVSIDIDTVCVNGSFTATFQETTLSAGNEFTIVVEYTDDNGSNSRTFTDVKSGDDQSFQEGVDFDGNLTVTRIIVTPEDPKYCSDTLDGFSVTVVACEATIVDPCVCQNNAQIGQNGTNSNTGTFKDVVRVEGPINQTWTVASVSGLYEDAAGTDPVDVGDAFTQVSPGVYELVGYHIDAIGYSIAVTNGRGVTLEANNKCFYPNPVFTGLPALVAPSAAPFQVTGTVADNVAGTGTFILDGVPQAGASAAPTVVTINPGTLSPGPHTLIYSFDAGVAASKDSLDPGCVQQVRQRFQVANCGCQDVTVSLNENCQFLLTGNLVSDVNCNGGTVRVMDNDPSNGALIDCAGVWTYGLFDAFGNIICWGKVTAEDKTAPALVCAPADITLDCYDVNYVLNNRLTIGNVGATSSPRPAATSPQTINNAEGVAGTGDNCQLGLVPAASSNMVSDNIKNLGYAYFKDNCYNCGCRITLKWSDKVEFYSCEQMKVNGGYYAVISREWTATDCNGMRSSYVQKIKFTRPAVDDFVFKDANPEGKYDHVVEYNSCTPDKSLIKKEDVTPYVCSYFNTSANPRCLFIDQVECNYSISIKDTEFPICGGKGVKIDRELYVLDWCAGGIVDTFHILIKIGDFTAPTVEYAHGAPYDISTGPMDCTAAIPVTVAGIKTAFGVTIKDNCNLGNISVSVYTKDRYVKGILVYEGPASPICTPQAREEAGDLRGDNDAYRLGACDKDKICWDKVEYAVMNGMMIGLPVGKHLMVIDAFDGCYNASTTCFIFEVKDKIAPIMKCDDDLHVTLSNANGYTNGYAQVSAADIDEGSWDNCKLDWIAVRRNVPDGCAASFIAKGYDTNGNGKLDALPADGDVSKADGFDRNGDGDIADFGETFILKGGKLMTPLLDFVEFFCCDLTERVTVELWGGDIYGNTNYCWMDLLIEDKVAPTCLAPWDVTIYCDDKNIASIDSKVGSAAAFGDVTIPSGNDCAALDTTYTTEKKLKCGAGYIDRIWTLTKQTAKGPISVTCKQRIHILPVHEYNICFPKDISTDCKTPIIDTVITDELGCDILAVNVHDKRYDASDDECYKIFRTYSVINWCTYDDRCGDPLLQTNVSIIDRAVFGNYGKAPIYVLVRDRKNNRRDGIEEFWVSKDLVAGNADDIDFTEEVPYCEVAGEFYHSFIYTQIIKVYDDTRPVVTGTRDTFCTSPTACTANITKVVTLKDNCTDKVELETQFLMIAPFQTLEAGKMILYSTPRWSTKDLGNGQFEIKVSNLPEGTHDLIVVGRDECGNLSLPTRIPFVVKDCKAPAPICINGLSVDLMPDGNGGGMMTVWATDFVASKIYDCNGQGPETKDGLKLITKYSVNRVQQPVNPNQTSISVNCADLELGFILVELHAWDEAGNHDFCVTFVEVQDNRKVCPAPADKVKIAGTIATEGAGNLQGVSVTLSGSGTQSDMTGTDGNYEFVNISKGGDFTVTPQLDKNHLNGVSTFDLVLIQKHILGVQALNSPYKMIAADANNSKSISTLDMIQIRKLILNIDTHFANNTSWRFVDATYRFPNPTNPWSTAFPEVVSVNDLVTNVRANFVAIKVGDVNASASVSGAASAEIRTREDFKLKTQEQNLKSGNEYKVSFTAEDLKDIQGYQFALNLDQSKVELLDLEYGVAKAENFGVFKNEGIITTSWNSKYEPGALFTLVLRAKADAKLSQSINLNRLVSPEAYDQNNENLGIALNFEGIQATEAYELRQNTPNPFSDETLIGFTLPKALKGTLTVRDVKGATIYKVEGNYAKGNNQVTLKKSQLGASGVLYYTLETTDFTATKKMVILE
ncbi:Calx-beta domain-containing protein [Haliscomenobacter sp.]|uniref:Calx-beta domain-containing protein n=1 Tax=Haliscomenobacter sp. TaxID=2717303 RepID=UPI003BABE046